MGAITAETTISWTDSRGGDHEGLLITRTKGFDVIACAICGFRHALPLSDPVELEEAYRESYYTQEKPTFLAHAGEDQEWAALSWRDRLESFERILTRERRRLLDIG